MKIKDVENIQSWLNDIKLIADRQSYNVSAEINKALVKIMPVMKAEADRLSSNKVEINCPRIHIFNELDLIKEHISAEDYFNKMMQELVSNDFKIIDFGELDNVSYNGTDTIRYYIKYTS